MPTPRDVARQTFCPECKALVHALRSPSLPGPMSCGACGHAWTIDEVDPAWWGVAVQSVLDAVATGSVAPGSPWPSWDAPDGSGVRISVGKCGPDTVRLHVTAPWVDVDPATRLRHSPVLLPRHWRDLRAAIVAEGGECVAMAVGVPPLTSLDVDVRPPMIHDSWKGDDDV